MEVYIISWIILAIIIGAVGSGRNIGFWGAFFLSLLLSPLLGLIFTLVSKSKETIKYEQEVLKTQKQQQETLEQIKSQNVSSMADDLKKIKDLLDSNVITEEEFEKMKSKIIANFEEPNKKRKIILENSFILPDYDSCEKIINSSTIPFYKKIIYQIKFKNNINGSYYKIVDQNDLDYYFETEDSKIHYSSRENTLRGLYFHLATGGVLTDSQIILENKNNAKPSKHI